MHERHIQALSRCRIFSGLEREELLAMLSCVRHNVTSYNKSNNIIQRDRVYDYFVVVLEGEVKTVHDLFENGSSMVEKMGPGQSFGLGYCLAQAPSHVCLRAVQKSTVMEIAYQNLATPCGRGCAFHTQVVSNVFDVLSQKVTTLSGKLNYMHLKTMRAKISRYILDHCAQGMPPQNQFYSDITMTELAEYLCVSRTSLARELCAMQEDGLIVYKARRFSVLDYKALACAAS